MHPIASSADAELGYVTEWQLPPPATTAGQPQSAAWDEGCEVQSVCPSVESTQVQPDGSPGGWSEDHSAA